MVQEGFQSSIKDVFFLSYHKFKEVVIGMGVYSPTSRGVQSRESAVESGLLLMKPIKYIDINSLATFIVHQSGQTIMATLATCIVHQSGQTIMARLLKTEAKQFQWRRHSNTRQYMGLATAFDRIILMNKFQKFTRVQ